MNNWNWKKITLVNIDSLNYLSTATFILIQPTSLIARVLHSYWKNKNVKSEQCIHYTECSDWTILEYENKNLTQKFHDRQPDHDFHTRTPKSSNQKAVFIDYDILIGCTCLYCNMSAKLVLKKYYDHRHLSQMWIKKYHNRVLRM